MMKNIVIIVAGSLISFLALLLLGLAVLKMKPELFGVGPESARPTIHAPADTAVHRSPGSIQQDNSRLQTARAVQAIHYVDTMLVASLEVRADSLEQLVDSLKKLPKMQSTEIKPAEQHDWLSSAKLLASMNADDAGKILKQMSDNDLKHILSKMQKRQAGKILSVLDPNRVARVLR